MTIEVKSYFSNLHQTERNEVYIVSDTGEKELFGRADLGADTMEMKLMAKGAIRAFERGGKA